jgi:2-oxoglutarate ferredoxin oxidoreductase subunit alpha
MNQWMTPPFEYPDMPMDRGKILWEADLDRLKGDWGRYRDVDGDGIPYRTLPGNRHTQAAYFSRGTGHDENARYTEDNQKWHALMDRLKRKYYNSREAVPAPIVENVEGAKIGFIAFGSTTPAIEEARHLLLEGGIKTSFLRVRAIPFTKEVDEFIGKHERIYVVEMNRDGQMHQLLTIEFPQYAMKLKSIAFMDGLPLTANFVRNAILNHEEK